MTKFEKSHWADTEFSQNYRDDAGIFLPFRYQFFVIAKSLYGYFIDPKFEGRILDLGCGDGLFVHELLQSFTPKSVTLVDGSAEMLNAAKKRLGNNAKINFMKATFQDVLTKKLLSGSFDFIYSSLAIHHLPFEEKKLLYCTIHKLLSPGGCFIHYDVVMPTSEKIEKWFLTEWREWIHRHPDKERSKRLLSIPEGYKENQDNIPDTLESQLQALEHIGFKEVDCFFKYGIFSLFGGFK